MQLIHTCQYSSDLLISWTSLLSFLFLNIYVGKRKNIKCCNKLNFKFYRIGLFKAGHGSGELFVQNRKNSSFAAHGNMCIFFFGFNIDKYAKTIQLNHLCRLHNVRKLSITTKVIASICSEEENYNLNYYNIKKSWTNWHTT